MATKRKTAQNRTPSTRVRAKKKATKKKKRATKRAKAQKKPKSVAEELGAGGFSALLDMNLQAVKRIEEVLGDRQVGQRVMDHAGIHSPRQRAFLEAFSVTGIVSKACLSAGVGRRTVYEWLEDAQASDPPGEFAAKFEEAKEIAGEWLEAEARRRAFNGVLKPVWYEGMLVGVETVYSDSLMKQLLQANNPKKYTPALHAKHSSPEDGPIEYIKVIELGPDPSEERAA